MAIIELARPADASKTGASQFGLLPLRGIAIVANTICLMGIAAAALAIGFELPQNADLRMLAYMGHFVMIYAFMLILFDLVTGLLFNSNLEHSIRNGLSGLALLGIAGAIASF